MTLLLTIGLAAVIVIVATGAVIFLTTPVASGPCAGSSVVCVTSPMLGKPAPDFTLTTTDGQTVKLSDYRGRPLIVNFWASWCIPCRAEFPQFEQARAANAAAGLEVLGIVHEDGADSATAFAAAEGAQWPLLMDPDNTAYNAFRAAGVPSTYFIDRDGIVRATSLGPVTDTSLPEQLKTIL